MSQSTAVKNAGRSLAGSLGWFSIGLGLAEMMAPKILAGAIGVAPRKSHLRLLRLMGLREFAIGIAVLAQPEKSAPLRARVMGDLLDLALLGAALGAPASKRLRLISAIASVAGVTALDLLGSRKLSRVERQADAAVARYRWSSPRAVGQSQQARAGGSPAPSLRAVFGAAESDDRCGSTYFIGNATMLIRCGGLNILTDPTFIHKHERVAIGYGMHTTRLTDPAVDIDQLPPLDLVVLSHFHGDHFDQVAERELDRSLPIVTTREATKELGQRGFFNAVALETWSSWEISKGDASLRITAMPGRHGPPLSDLVMPDVMGSLLEFTTPSGDFKLYITGDTLVIDDIKEIPRRYSEIDLALLHLGGTRVLGMLATMDAKQGVEMVQIIKPQKAIPIHYDDYDVFKSPLSDFVEAVTVAGLQDRVRYLNRGESFEFALRNEKSHVQRGAIENRGRSAWTE